MNKKKAILFLMASFSLLGLDLFFTYVTFGIRHAPLDWEVNAVFRNWVLQDGWLISMGKFTLLKICMFSLCGWVIFRTSSRILAFVLAQSSVTNHLVAISSHPTLWWIQDKSLRVILLKTIGIASLVLTYYGIRYLRSTQNGATTRAVEGFLLQKNGGPVHPLDPPIPEYNSFVAFTNSRELG